MKKLLILVLTLAMCLLLTGESHSQTTFSLEPIQEVPAFGGKITPIKAIIMVFEGGGRSDFHGVAKFSKVKVLTREHLDILFREQELQFTGLTQTQRTAKAGELLGASHILLYSYYGPQLMHFKLINISTSEIEYQSVVAYGGEWEFEIKNFYEMLDSHAVSLGEGEKIIGQFDYIPQDKPKVKAVSPSER